MKAAPPKRARLLIATPTLWRSARGPVTKILHLKNGEPANDSSRCGFVEGTAHRLAIFSVAEFAAQLDHTPDNGLYTMGSLRRDLPDRVDAGTKAACTDARTTIISRSKEFLSFSQEPGFVCIDIDIKNAPAPVREKIAEAGGASEALGQIWPDLKTCGHVLRPSTSSGLYDKNTRASYSAKTTGAHLYVRLSDMSETAAMLEALHASCWLKGFGWYVIAADGGLLERSLVDLAMRQPNQPCFEAAPELKPPLAQKPRRAIWQEGPPLDWRQYELKAEEKKNLEKLKAAARQHLDPEARRLKSAYVEQVTAEAIERGATPQDAKRMAEARVNPGRRILYPSALIYLDNDEAVSVADILADPTKYRGESCADPNEPDYRGGRGHARIFVKDNGRIVVSSWAHGHQRIYELRDDNDPSWGPYSMTPEGLFFEKTVGRGANALVERVRVADTFEIAGRCRNPQGRDWGKFIIWRDADGRAHELYLSEPVLHGPSDEVAKSLASDGLRVNRREHNALADYISEARVTASIIKVSRTGWHEGLFVLPQETVGHAGGDRIIFDGADNARYETRGSLKAWKRNVGTLSRGQDLAMLVLSAAFAGPLLELVAFNEGGGIQLVGPSSIGKTTMLCIAASVWGRGETGRGYVRTWRATANGLEGVAEAVTDTCLVIDELSQSMAEEAGRAVYMLSGGSGKLRAAGSGNLRDPKSFRVMIISSGEVGLEQKIQEERRGARARAGQLIRLVDVEADQGQGYGAFTHLGAFDKAAKLSKKMQAAAIENYGTAGPEFVRCILEDGAENIATQVRDWIEDFVAQHAPMATGQVDRVARRFGLIAAAGELATDFKIVPWSRDDAWNACATLFQRWLKARGGSGPAEERMAIEQVRAFIERFGESRFDNLDIADRRNIPDRAGWTDGVGEAQRWYIPPTVWKTTICTGIDPKLTAKALARRGMLKPGSRTRLQGQVWAEGRNNRVYMLTSMIML